MELADNRIQSSASAPLDNKKKEEMVSLVLLDFYGSAIGIHHTYSRHSADEVHSLPLPANGCILTEGYSNLQEEMKKTLYILAFSFVTLAMQAQQKGFTVTGQLNMLDGTSVGIVAQKNNSSSEDVASGVVKDGKFQLTGAIGQPQPATFMTNNLDLVEKNGWPTDSIKWTYTEMFLSDDNITVTPDLKIEGGEIQSDYNAFIAEGGEYQADPWTFIETHPQSVISVWLANKLFERAYNLEASQVEKLESNIKENPLDPQRYEEFRQRITDAKKTTIGSPLLDLPVIDTKGNEVMLTTVLPQKKYVLIDFWASWCGICIHAMPEIKQIAEKYNDVLGVIGVSIDEKESAWKAAMQRNPEPWAQYMTTDEGYRTISKKYQLGAGVPYYLLLDDKGCVLKSPGNPEEISELLKKLIQ